MVFAFALHCIVSHLTDLTDLTLDLVDTLDTGFYTGLTLPDARMYFASLDVCALPSAARVFQTDLARQTLDT